MPRRTALLVAFWRRDLTVGSAGRLSWRNHRQTRSASAKAGKRVNIEERREIEMMNRALMTVALLFFATASLAQAPRTTRAE